MKRAPLYRVPITASDVIFGVMCAALPLLVALSLWDWLVGTNTFASLLGALK